MDFVENKNFNEYIESYKKLNLVDKQDEIIYLLKENIACIKMLLKVKNIEVNMLFNREMLDLKHDNYTQDDFAEAIFVYLHSFRELLAELLLKKGGI